MIWRAALVAAAVLVALVVVRFWERRAIVERSAQLSTGLTLVTGADCRLCPLAVAALDGADIPVTVVDVAALTDCGIKSVPTALVTDRSGTVIASRTGRAAVSGMPDMIALARGVV